MFPYSEIGIFGSLLLAGAFIPQCYRLLNTKSARDISFLYPFVLSAGSFCLTVYGYGIRDAIVFTLNLYATFCNVELVLLKIYYDSNRDKKEKMPAHGGR
jgi:MtN3 and saliva related transmembrane protein